MFKLIFKDGIPSLFHRQGTNKSANYPNIPRLIHTWNCKSLNIRHFRFQVRRGIAHLEEREGHTEDWDVGRGSEVRLFSRTWKRK